MSDGTTNNADAEDTAGVTGVWIRDGKACYFVDGYCCTEEKFCRDTGLALVKCSQEPKGNAER